MNWLNDILISNWDISRERWIWTNTNNFEDYLIYLIEFSREINSTYISSCLVFTQWTNFSWETPSTTIGIKEWSDPHISEHWP